MAYRYIERLYARRAELEAKLELHDARYCFGDGDVEDGTDSDLRSRIDELTREIETLERTHPF